MTAEPINEDNSERNPDRASAALNSHTHDYTEVCTSACPASPWYDPTAPSEDELTIAFLAGKVEALRAEVAALTEKQSEIAEMLSTVVEQVGPTLDQLSSHPMFKMIFGGK